MAMLFLMAFTTADVILDFHTGGADRFNAPQIRISPEQTHLQNLAECFGAPFIVHAKSINKSYRHACSKLGIPMLLFEGGKSVQINNNNNSP